MFNVYKNNLRFTLIISFSEIELIMFGKLVKVILSFTKKSRILGVAHL